MGLIWYKLNEKGFKLTPIFYALVVMLLSVSVSRIWAKSPKTAKIVFTSTRAGNKEIYTINPDGSQTGQRKRGWRTSRWRSISNLQNRSERRETETTHIPRTQYPSGLV